MKALGQLVIRQSGIMALLCLLFALAHGVEVCQGLWKGIGLHGYFMQPGAKGGGPHFVSVWDAFLSMLAAFGLAMPFGLAALWQGNVRQRLGKAGAVENSGRENTLPAKRRQRRRT